MIFPAASTKRAKSTCFRDKNILCFLIIILFTCLFFARSIVVRERWIVPTFLSNSPHQDAAPQLLSRINNWLKGGILELRFSSYNYPDSVEMPTLDKRGFYGSFPPGSILPIYCIFKFLDFTLIPNIYEKRGIQLVLLILWNYLQHFLLTLVLCGIVFVVCRKIGFDNLNSTILSIIPAIIQFNNANSLYYHHLFYAQDTEVMLVFVLYVFLELLLAGVTSLPPRIKIIVRTIHPLLMFWGVLTSWFFVFVVLTVYAMRMIRREICPPTSLRLGLCWARQSLLFFIPSLIAVAIWIYQIAHYLLNIAHSNIFNATMTSTENSPLYEKIINEMGFNKGIDVIIANIKMSLYTQTKNGFGISGFLIIYIVLYMAVRYRKLMVKDDDHSNHMVIAYLMLSIPCIASHLFFAQNYAEHSYTSLLFSPSLSVSFVFASIFVLGMLKDIPQIQAISLIKGKKLTAAALLALTSSIVYGYSQVYDKQSVTKMFSSPAYHHVIIGNFIRENTDYNDVVFSKDYFNTYKWDLMATHFTLKRIHFLENLGTIYKKTDEIRSAFTVKIFYMESSKYYIDRIDHLLTSNNIQTHWIKKEGMGGLLVFEGKEFNIWHEQVHECDKFPQRCSGEW